ncbi:hypothetical protein M8A51_07900 [Schlegelella sp. S2-27]|uniref:Uncharacterized protein n=1 Tax=Caldimonas mangrovi TaxID=2944811 RepID=A0ABT0YL35_9BURK|nr:hypothetical protein [Caldimonas mangrovi]MCM5679451.1 hypothetical protein [Caldimonas mangrovi]
MGLAVLVGNAPPREDLRRIIDGADFVARINTCAALGAEYGRRTDRVYLCNTGGVARRFIGSEELHRTIAGSGARDVVFSYPRVPLRRLLHCILRGKRGTGVDRTQALTQVLSHHGLRCSPMPQEVFDEVVAFVKAQPGFDGYPRRMPLWTPSSGGVALAHLARDPVLARHSIALAGFGFQGWEGHPWFAERAYAEQLQQAGRLSFLDR